MTPTVAPDLALAALDALHCGEDRIATPELLDRLRIDHPELRAETLGKALTAAAWKPAQWRTGGRRVRGYCRPIGAPAGQDWPAEAEALAPRCQDPSRTPNGALPAVTGSMARKTVPAMPAFRQGIAGPGAHADARLPVFRCPTCGGARFRQPNPVTRFCTRCCP